MRLATGSFADVISTNQTLTDFFDRKPFAVDQAYLTYKPKALAGFQVQAGKTYYLQASNLFGPGQLQVDVKQVLPPDNDDFALLSTRFHPDT